MGEAAALIMAAGRGVRAGGGLPKQYRPLAGAPMVRHSVLRFLSHPAVDRVRLVIQPGDRDQLGADNRANGKVEGLARCAGHALIERGGVLHWTHHDPDGRRPGGWLEHEGRRYR